ncbi:MAG TPA: hypothetical protein VGM76_02920 [Lacipirellulaceae bacterium]|jgi:hypothetical protein
MQKLILYSSLFGGLLAIFAPSWAGEIAQPTKSRNDADESWTYQPPTSSVTTARAIVQQKAEIRAQQRMDRLAAQSWYGVSLSRPTLTGTPFTMPRASWWDRPNQLPNAWYEAVQRPFNVHVTSDERVAQRGYQPVIQ